LKQCDLPGNTLTITGKILIGSRSLVDHGTTFKAVNPATGEMMEPAFPTAGEAEVAQACALAAAAFANYRESAPALRANFLNQIAENILALGDELIDRASAETGLPRGRLEGERGRTVAQLRLFGEVVRSGDWQRLRMDHAMPERKPAPRPDLRLRHIALGPVAVFGASNFPLAFSVAGGDTASALAAGCPVVVKAHPAHPGTSELVGCAVQKAVMRMKLHEGVFSMLTGAGTQLGASLVADPRIKAVGFTGSRAGGLALMKIAAARQVPIPVYAEMSSINPVILLPAALAARAGVIGKEFAASLTLGAGQFCTNPGLVLALDGPGFEDFLTAAKTAVSASPAATMLTPGIHAAYEAQIDRLTHHEAVQQVAQGLAGTGPNQCQTHLMSVDAQAFLNDPALQAETFGAASMVIRCADLPMLQAVIAGLEGQLTATLQMDAQDLVTARVLLPLLEQKVGRILVNGFPTGVEVAHAMVHGGPFPASSDARSTSVGSLAIERFLRPVCYQDFPDALLPDALKNKKNEAAVMQRPS
jgi:2,5-dioxopentanoate dehydrogenase